MQYAQHPVTIVPIDATKAEEIAAIIAAYYNRLRADDLPPDLIADLTREWQAAYLKNHGVTTIKTGTVDRLV